MKKKLFLAFTGLAMSATLLSGCNSIHLHTIDVPFEYNDEGHWKTCSSCGEKFAVGEHIVNDLTDKCLVCDYVDPIFKVDENGLMTGLTNHGKTKLILDLPSNVEYVAKDALDESKALLVNLDKELKGYYEGAFDKPNLLVKPAEEEVTWEFKDGIYHKHDILTEYDARIGNTLYKTLDEAFEAFTVNDTTITILKDDLTIDHQIVVNHDVTLESYHSHATLNCDFSINATCTLYVPKSITLKSNVRLMLANTREEIEDYFEDVYSPGSIAFMGIDTKPENVDVRYVGDFDIDIELGYKAVGSKQVANSLIVALPVTHYAYGTFVFSKDFKQVKGLSSYGLTVSDLYITNIVEGINAVIPYHAFSIYTDIKINIHKIKDTHITLNQTKGMFTSLHICDGITEIGEMAFTNETTDDLFHEVKIQIALLLSHILSLEIGDSVKTIGDYAFDGQLSIEEIRGGKGLTKIGKCAFRENSSLRILDLSEAYNLTTIERRAFYLCDELVSAFIPNAGWKIPNGYKHEIGKGLVRLKETVYLPIQSDPELIAYHLVHTCECSWEKGETGHIAYTKTTAVDSTGRYCEVSYTDSMSTAISNCADTGWIEMLDGIAENQKHINLQTINKSLSIFADLSVENATIGTVGNDLVINNNMYLTLSNVTPLGSILLKTTEADNGIKTTGGFAIRSDSNDVPELQIRNDVQNKELETPLPNNACLISDQEYKAYGLFNFKNELDGEGKIVKQIITGTARMGSISTGIEIKEQVGADVEVEIASEAFINNNAIKNVLINGNVSFIGEKSFMNCKSLKTVEIIERNGKIDLTSIGTSAFQECSNLVSFVINGNDSEFYKINNYAFSNCSNLAWLDIGEAKNVNWTRSNMWKVSTDTLANCASFAELVTFFGNEYFARMQ